MVDATSNWATAAARPPLGLKGPRPGFRSTVPSSVQFHACASGHAQLQHSSACAVSPNLQPAPGRRHIAAAVKTPDAPAAGRFTDSYRHRPRTELRRVERALKRSIDGSGVCQTRGAPVTPPSVRRSQHQIQNVHCQHGTSCEAHQCITGQSLGHWLASWLRNCVGKGALARFAAGGSKVCWCQQSGGSAQSPESACAFPCLVQATPTTRKALQARGQASKGRPRWPETRRDLSCRIPASALPPPPAPYSGSPLAALLASFNSLPPALGWASPWGALEGNVQVRQAH